MFLCGVILILCVPVGLSVNDSTESDSLTLVPEARLTSEMLSCRCGSCD